MRFCQSLTTAKEKLDKFYRSHRKAIEKARPYYSGRALLEKVRDPVHTLYPPWADPEGVHGLGAQSECSIIPSRNSKSDWLRGHRTQYFEGLEGTYPQPPWSRACPMHFEIRGSLRDVAFFFRSK